MEKPVIEFVRFPKIARLNREVIVTEKIDGTNAQIYIPEPSTNALGEPRSEIYAASRTRWITPEDDNHGFAKWVQANKDELMKLGPGHHFGEWCGSGIQRGYGLKEKRFALFNVSRWGTLLERDPDPTKPDRLFTNRPACCHVVPVLWKGLFEEMELDDILGRLRIEGSHFAPGFMNPEGIVIYHAASKQLFKKTLEKDESPKGRTES